MHRLDLIARLLDLRATDHPTSGPVILGDENSEENYELDAVLEAIVRRLIDCEHRTAEALMNAAHALKATADLQAKCNEPCDDPLRCIQARVRSYGLERPI